MEKWFVQATKGNTTIKMPCRGVRETTIEIGPIKKRIKAQAAAQEAANCKAQLIKHGWTNVKIIRSRPAVAA